MTTLARFLPCQDEGSTLPFDALDWANRANAIIQQLYKGVALPLSNVSGTNTITAQCTPALTAYHAGMMFILVPANSTTGAATLNIDSVGAKNIKQADASALSSSITLVAGVSYLLLYDGTNLVVVNTAFSSFGLSLINAASASAAGLPGVKVASASFSGAATVDITGVLTSTYHSYLLVLSGVTINTDDVQLLLQVGTGGGPTWQTATPPSGTSYQIYGHRVGSGATDTLEAGSASAIYLSSAVSGARLGTNTGEVYNGTVLFDDPTNVNTFKEFKVDARYSWSNGNSGEWDGGGRYNTAGAITGLRITCVGGAAQITGKYALYGLTH